MLLSVVIPFCDNDYMLLDRAINSIREHIKFNDYEIIVVDNRETKKEEKVILKNMKVISKGYNIYTFESRRFGCQNSQGTYIWNFDADDEMIGDLFEEDIKDGYDFLQIYYLHDENTKPRPAPLLKRYPPNMFGPCVWSRLYKKDLLKKIYTRLEKPILVPKFEDRILFDFVMSYNPKYEYIERPIYMYNHSISTTNTRLMEKVDKIGMEGYTYPYQILGKPSIAEDLKRKVGSMYQKLKKAEERKCQNLKESSNLNIQKS